MKEENMPRAASWGVPLGSFIFALLLASLAGPNPKVVAAREPGQETDKKKGNCSVVIDKANLVWQDDAANNQLKLKVEATAGSTDGAWTATMKMEIKGKFKDNATGKVQVLVIAEQSAIPASGAAGVPGNLKIEGEAGKNALKAVIANIETTKAVTFQDAVEKLELSVVANVSDDKGCKKEDTEKKEAPSKPKK